MKKAVFVVAVLLLLALSPILAVAAPTKESRVFDEAGLFTDSEIESLEAQISELREELQQDFVVLTIDDDLGKTSRDYADDYYDENGFGYGADYSGALLLINMDEREPHISTTGHMIDILDDARIESVLDLQYGYLVDGEYYQAMAMSLQRMAEYAKTGPVMGQYREAEGESDIDPFSFGWIAFSLFAGLLVAGIVSIIIYARYQKNYIAVPYDYKSNARLSLGIREDAFITRNVARTYSPPPPPSSSSSGGSRSTTHRSSSGRSHGGGTGRKF